MSVLLSFLRVEMQSGKEPKREKRPNVATLRSEVFVAHLGGRGSVGYLIHLLLCLELRLELLNHLVDGLLDDLELPFFCFLKIRRR